MACMKPSAIPLLQEKDPRMWLALASTGELGCRLCVGICTSWRQQQRTMNYKKVRVAAVASYTSNSWMDIDTGTDTKHTRSDADMWN